MYTPVDDYLIVDVNRADDFLSVRAWKPDGLAGVK